MQKRTIQELLTSTAEYLTRKGIDSPRLSAELLLSHVLGVRRIDLYSHSDTAVSEEQSQRLQQLVKRAAKHEPVAYLLGQTEFYSLPLYVTGDCMIPRPETELLVAMAIEFLRTRGGSQFVCDLGTGSGCIAIAIAKNVTNAEIVATDISDAALRIAAKNIARHRLKGRIRLLSGHLFEPIAAEAEPAEFDLIVCNPPYVSGAEFENLDRNVRDYEPKPAFFAGDDGLDFYRKIVERVDTFLKSDAALMLEIGCNQGPAVRRLLQESGCFRHVTIEKDFQNRDRLAIACKTRRGQ